VARYVGLVPRPYADVWPTIDSVALGQGWKVEPMLSFEVRRLTKGVSWFSWGAALTLALHDMGPHTRVTIDITNTSIVDMARARGVAQKLVVGLGGTLVS
jgi:hypothetical protein